MTLLDVMERHGYTLERLAGAIGIAPEALNRKMVENSFTIGDAQRIIEALSLTTEEVMATFFPAGRDKSVFVVQRCLVTLDLPVKQLAGVYATLDGAVDALESDAAAAGAEFVCDPGDDAWRVWIGREEFVIHEEPVRK